MKINILLFSFFLFVVSALLIGCSSPSALMKDRFVRSKVDLLRPGMSIAEIDTLFGTPTIFYTMDFGKETSHPWKGLVYEYQTVRDKNYKYIEKYKVNKFVFTTATDPPKLNHWKIEYFREPTEEK